MATKQPKKQTPDDSRHNTDRFTTEGSKVGNDRVFRWRVLDPQPPVEIVEVDPSVQTVLRCSECKKEISTDDARWIHWSESKTRYNGKTETQQCQSLIHFGCYDNVDVEEEPEDWDEDEDGPWEESIENDPYFNYVGSDDLPIAMLESRIERRKCDRRGTKADRRGRKRDRRKS